jgi:hypothetical protein
MRGAYLGRRYRHLQARRSFPCPGAKEGKAAAKALWTIDHDKAHMGIIYHQLQSLSAHTLVGSSRINLQLNGGGKLEQRNQ